MTRTPVANPQFFSGTTVGAVIDGVVFDSANGTIHTATLVVPEVVRWIWSFMKFVFGVWPVPAGELGNGAAATEASLLPPDPRDISG